MLIEETELAPEPVVEQEVPPVEPTPPPEKKMVTVTTDTFQKIRAEENAKGKKAAAEELEARAKALGFASIDEMFAAAESTKQPKPREGDEPVTVKPTPKPAQKPSTKAVPSKPEAPSAAERAAGRWKAEKERQARVLAAETRKRKEAERTNAALRAEIQLRESAIRAGVVDVEYALVLVKREMASLSQEQIKEGFDEVKFFESLRTTKPILFSVELRPGNTAPSGGGNPPPPPPKPQEIAERNPDTKPVDARTMTREEYKAHLAKRNIALR